jgi:hypothetical protein
MQGGGRLGQARGVMQNMASKVRMVAAPEKARWQVTSSDGVAVIVRRVNMTMWDNVGGLFMFLAISGVIGAFMLGLAYMSWGACSRWKKQQAHVSESDTVFAKGNVSKADAGKTYDDDIPVVPKKAPDGMDLDLPPDPGAVMMRRRMDKVKAKYGAYNSALRTHLARHGHHGPPDDVIDRRILSGKDEDFDYSADKDRVKKWPDGLPMDKTV